MFFARSWIILLSPNGALKNKGNLAWKDCKASKPKKTERNKLGWMFRLFTCMHTCIQLFQLLNPLLKLVQDELKVKNHEKKFGMAVDVRFLENCSDFRLQFMH